MYLNVKIVRCMHRHGHAKSEKKMKERDAIKHARSGVEETITANIRGDASRSWIIILADWDFRRGPQRLMSMRRRARTMNERVYTCRWSGHLKGADEISRSTINRGRAWLAWIATLTGGSSPMRHLVEPRKKGHFRRTSMRTFSSSSDREIAALLRTNIPMHVNHGSWIMCGSRFKGIPDCMTSSGDWHG